MRRGNEDGSARRFRPVVIGANCYASALNIRRGTGHAYLPANRDKVEWRLNERELAAILRRRKPARIFMCDMTDLFHEDVPDEFIAAIWKTMAQAPQHTFQVLTKRPDRMRRALTLSPRLRLAARDYWPLPNVWIGVSVENQRMADERIPVLLDTPAAIRFLSCEPLLGPLDLTPWLERRVLHSPDLGGVGTNSYAPRVSWVIVGGESGPGRAERKLVERCNHWLMTEACHGTGWRPKPQALKWVRRIRDDCVAAGTAFHLKQLGGPRPTSGGRLLDGRTWDEFPCQ